MKAWRSDYKIHTGQTVAQFTGQACNAALSHTDDQWPYHQPSPSVLTSASAFTTDEAIAEPPRVP